MKSSLTLLLGFALLLGSSMSAMAEAMTVNQDHQPNLTIVQNRDCKGDKDDNCR